MRFSDESVALQAWSYCFDSVCIDGSPPAEPADVGNPEEVAVEFPLPGWSFTASFRPAGDECGRVQEVPLEAGGDGRLVLPPAGRAGAYDVTLFGRGDGDLVTTFRWTTPGDGVPATPQARLAVLAGDDEEVDSYGVELELTNLARTPRQASATITIEAADGKAVTFDATRSRLPCLPTSTGMGRTRKASPLPHSARDPSRTGSRSSSTALARGRRRLAGRRDPRQRALGGTGLHSEPTRAPLALGLRPDTADLGGELGVWRLSPTQESRLRSF